MPVENVPGTKPILVQSSKKEEVKQKIAQTEKEIKDGKKKLALALGGLAVTGAATIGIALAIKKRKTNAIKQQAQLSIADFKKIGKFDKGIATIDGNGFTGEILTKNGTKLTYKDGLIQESVSETIKKTWDYEPDGTKIINILDSKPGADKSVDVIDGTTIYFSPKKVTISPDKTIKTETYSNYSGTIPLIVNNEGVKYSHRVKTVTPDGKISDITTTRRVVQNPNFKNEKEIEYETITDNLTGKTSVKKPIK